MAARYLIRLDDACETMRSRNWDLVEQVLDAHRVKPIVAVIPENRDPSLIFEPPNAAFWQRVRGWSAKGWSVGLHGYTHVMHLTADRLVLPFYKRSEFAGLPLKAQSEKIRAAWNRFMSEGVEPSIWVAPAHSFDLLTLQAVQSETTIRIVSDGIAWDTFYEHDFNWIPQQIWGLVERSSGLWTACLHPNTMSAESIDALDGALGGQFRGRMTCVDELELPRRRKSAISRLYEMYFWWRWKRATPAC